MIAQVSMTVKDLEETIEFYEKYIGLRVVKDEREHGMPIAFMAADEKDQTILELIQSDHPYQGSGIFLGVQTADFEERRSFLAAEGLQVSDVISPAPGVRFFLVPDPNGLQVKMIEEAAR